MSERVVNTVYFETAGKENTGRVLELAKYRVEELGIKSVVIATTTGETAARAVKNFSGRNIIAVTHSTGFHEPNSQELTDGNRKMIEEGEAKLLTTTHAFGGVNRAVRRKLNTYQLDEIIAFTLRIFGEGMKVAAEMSLMAADAGLIRVDEPAMMIAGTGRGADTAVLLLPSHAQDFFGLKILEIVCMPAPMHPGFS